VTQPREVARVAIPTAYGEFDTRAYESPSGPVYLALVHGDLGDGRSVLARVHSECLTGDALGSRRCDCGVQLNDAMRRIAAEGRGVLLYATGHEGRGVGLVNKLLAYVQQDRGADTVDANLRLGLPADGRTYDDAAAVIRALGVRTVRLLTNNPRKVSGLEDAGVEVEAVLALPTAPHLRNVGYLDAKRRRLGHVRPTGVSPAAPSPAPPDVMTLLGRASPRPWRPYLVVKYAQSLDGRIATGAGDARWISGEPERRLSHALRAACDAVLVGIGTVLADDTRLTARLVPGASPTRVVLDSRLRIPLSANVVTDGGATVVLTTERANPVRRRALSARGVTVRTVAASRRGVHVGAALRDLRGIGVRSVLVEGGGEVITSMLVAGVVDRLIVSLAPRILGSGTDAVGDLGVARVADGLRPVDRSFHVIGEDLVLAGDVGGAGVAGTPAPLVAGGDGVSPGRP
jgi:GTP cyclohydrolase II